jgi:hypothetical protein
MAAKTIAEICTSEVLRALVSHHKKRSMMQRLCLWNAGHYPGECESVVNPEAEEVGPPVQVCVVKLVAQQVQHIACSKTNAELAEAGKEREPDIKRDILVTMQQVKKPLGSPVITEVKKSAGTEIEATIHPVVKEVIQIDEDAYETAGNTRNPGLEQQPQDYAGTDTYRDMLVRLHNLIYTTAKPLEKAIARGPGSGAC